MISVDTERLVDDYMQRLASAARVLPKERQAELVSEIRFHVADALRASDAVDEADVRNVLERIGTPEEIVAAAVEGQPPVRDAQSRFGTLEVAAILILGLGGFFVPVVGWLVGVVLVWISGAWSTRDKLIGTAAPFVLVVLMPVLFLLGGVAAGGGGNFGPTEVLFISAAGTGLLGGIAGAVFLAARLSVDTRAEHKRVQVLKIALGIVVGGLLFVLVLGLFFVGVGAIGFVSDRGSNPAVQGADSPRAPITTTQYDNAKIGTTTRDAVVADFGEPVATCAASRCEGPGTVSNGPYRDVIGVTVPVGSTCVYYNQGDTVELYTLCFDTKTGKLLTKSPS